MVAKQGKLSDNHCTLGEETKTRSWKSEYSEYEACLGTPFERWPIGPEGVRQSEADGGGDQRRRGSQRDEWDEPAATTPGAAMDRNQTKR
jgi:hypothetical protein